MTKLVGIILFVAVITSADAIQCNFFYRDIDVVDAGNNIVQTKESKGPIDEITATPFDCEDPSLSDFVPLNVSKIDVHTRIETDDSDYVEEETCHAVKKTIQPKELNNVYNKLKKIAVVQSFSIEECVNVKSNCSREPVPKNKRVICKQNFLTIKLMALDDNNKKYDEMFYYPSACTCATYLKKSDL